ncbi:MAG TPA: PQQ-binding-like beta-propeller repeat protein, partial [Clostridia bacterium]|nr:PQQ-binding-like beta-propeller repeat protein [Clostridia bacterium]
VNPDGSPRWKLRTGSITGSSPIIGEDGTIYVGVNAKVYGVSPQGEKIWEREAISGSVEPVQASLFALEGGYTGFVSRYGMLTLLDPEKKPRWTYYLYGHGHSSPAVGADGTIYTFAHVMNEGYFFRALKSTLPLARSPWPKFRANPQNTGRSPAGK